MIIGSKKKPYFDPIDREILKQDNSYSDSLMRLTILKHRLCKEILKSFTPIYETIFWLVTFLFKK